MRDNNPFFIQTVVKNYTFFKLDVSSFRHFFIFKTFLVDKFTGKINKLFSYRWMRIFKVMKDE